MCVGNPDDQFVNMVASRRGVLKSQANNPVVVVDTYAPVIYNRKQHTSTVRKCDCELLTQEVKCSACIAYRPTLRKMCARRSDRPSAESIEDSSNTNKRYFNTPERKEKMRKMKKRISADEKEVVKLQLKIEQLTQECGQTLDNALNSDLLGIMQDKSDEIRDAYPERSFKRLFWDE